MPNFCQLFRHCFYSQDAISFKFQFLCLFMIKILSNLTHLIKNFITELTLKVSKSQKHFFLKIHCPKKEQILLQLHRAEFWLIFCSFLGQWSFKKRMLLRFTDLQYLYSQANPHYLFRFITGLHTLLRFLFIWPIS